MSTSPERCLGDLMKDIEKEDSPREDDSKDETAYKTSAELVLSLDSLYSLQSSTSSQLEDLMKNPKINCYSKAEIFLAFNTLKTTLVLQNCLTNSTKEERDHIIKELSGSFSQIIKNKNGNYYCKDFFKNCDKEQINIILNELKETISDDCIDEFGSHPIQTLVELINSEEEYKLFLSSFSDPEKILRASLNLNGSYVVQKIFVHIPEKYRMEFNINFAKFILILSVNMYGVCTVKKFIGYTKNDILIKQTLNIIISNFVNICQNKYGNYLIQYLLEYWWKTKEGVPLKKICISKFTTLAMSHYSSYICGLYITLSNQEEKKCLISSITKEKAYDTLKSDSIGNIILNKLLSALKTSKDESKKEEKKFIPLSLNNIRPIFRPKKKE